MNTRLLRSIGLLCLILSTYAGPVAGGVFPNWKEVFVYSETDFKGEKHVFKLPEGYRHKIIWNVPTQTGAFKSIRTGSAVQASTFGQTNLEGGDKAIIYDKSASFQHSSGYRSLIIYPINYPLGQVTAPPLLYPPGANVGGKTDLKPSFGVGVVNTWQGRYFPLPENEKLNSVCTPYDEFANTPMDTIRVYGNGTKMTLYSTNDCSGGLNISLFHNTDGHYTKYDAHKPPINGMQKRVHSVKVELMPVLIPKLPAVKVVPDLTILEPITPTIEGKWESNVGTIYQVVQFEQDKNKGKIRTLPPQGPVADFVIKGKELTATYRDPNTGKPTVSKGVITKMLGDTYAHEITWDNTIIMFRTITADTEPSPTVPGDQLQAKAPDLNGVWNSSIGLLYTIVHNVNHFSWTIKGSKETGSGTINGKKMQAAWQTGTNISGQGTATVTKVNGNGEATEIVWNNGIRFFR